MSTRSIFVVTGRASRFMGEHQTVRIYKHGDGYPTDNLAVLVEATEKANNLISANNADLESDSPSRLSLDGMGAKAFADCIIASTLSAYSGFRCQIDKDDNTVSNSGLDDGLAIFNEPLKDSHFGNQGDLEWIYVVDLKAKSINVYSGGYESPDEILPRGVVDPRSYAEHLIEEAQVRERSEIAAHMDRLMDLGWNLNGSADASPAKPKRKGRKKVAAK
jgi:hypothetical protein